MKYIYMFFVYDPLMLLETFSTTKHTQNVCACQYKWSRQFFGKIALVAAFFHLCYLFLQYLGP